MNISLETLTEQMRRDSADRICVVQKLDEFAQWIELLRQRRVRLGLEIGTYQGGTAILTARFVPTLERIVTVDVRDLLDRQSDLFREHLPRIHFLHGDCRDPVVVRQITAAADGNLFDFVFIDGDHAYERVQQDHVDFWPLLAPGGVMGFHDIQVREGVRQYWNELKAAGAPVLAEFLVPGAWGIGVLEKEPFR